MDSQTPTTPGKTLDPLARYVHAETGLAYRNFAAFILREEDPGEEDRNASIRQYRASRYPEFAIRAYWRAYDAHPGVWVRGTISPPEFRAANHDERHRLGLEAGKATGCWGPKAFTSPVKPPVDPFGRKLYSSSLDA